MTLLGTIFLVLINIFNNVTFNSPNVEGLKAISSRFTFTACNSISFNESTLSFFPLARIITYILFVFVTLCGYAGILFMKNILTKSDHVKFFPLRPLKIVKWHGNLLAYIANIFIVLFPLALHSSTFCNGRYFSQQTKYKTLWWVYCWM